MKPITLIAALAFSVSFLSHAQAQVVIVSAKNPISKLTKEQVAQLFMGQSHTFITGGQAEPLDLEDGSELRKAFYLKVLNKPPAQMKAFWSKLEFSGNARAPKALKSADMLKLVSENPKFVGYVDAAAVTPAVKVVFTP
jgi:ABC-type phosphate transport system substrate-binding protein